MIRKWRNSTFIAAAFCLLACMVGPRSAHAHPHVFATVKTEIVFGPSNEVTGFRHAWTFDEMYSSFAVTDMDVNKDGVYDRQELKELTDINIQSLSEFDYFTFPKREGSPLALQAPYDAWLEFKNEQLTLHFSLNLAKPLPAADLNALTFAVYDKVNYISFAFADDAPVALSGQPPAECAASVRPPDQNPQPSSLSETDYNMLGPDADVGAIYASTVSVVCGAEAVAAAEKAARERIAAAQADQQFNPFPSGNETQPEVGDAAPPGAPQGGAGFWQWIQVTQQALNQQLVKHVRDLKEENALMAGFMLALVSFIYGVVHAAGPGHGKAIISSYVLANERTLRRGVMLAVLASIAQAFSAVAMVALLMVVIRAVNIRMENAVAWLETLSFALIALIGAWMLISALRRAWAASELYAEAAPRSLSAAASPERARSVPHDHHAHHAHGRECGCDHSHAPDPSQLQGDLSWRKAAAIILAIGIRPCTGAILVLVFALTQGLFWAGVASTFAMAAGTAITVSALAVLAVGSRDLAVRLAGERSSWGARIEAGAAIGGSFCVMIIGAALFLGSLGPVKPFAF